MWALRRGANPFRNNGYLLCVSRASFSKLEFPNETEANVLRNWQRTVNNIECHQCRSTKRFFHCPSFKNKFMVEGRSLSSQAGTESGKDDEELEDGFSELETAQDTDDSGEEVGESKVSEPELSDDDSTENVSENLQVEPCLSEEEGGSFVEKEAPKKSVESRLFKVILDAQRQSIHSAIDKWVADGNVVNREVVWGAMFNLRKRRMFARALQLSDWLDANKPFEVNERDYASRVDLIAKVHGIHRAEKYIEKLPQPVRGEVVYRTLLANCSTTTNVKKAEEVFNKMKDLGFEMTAFSYNQLILIYKRIDKKKIADVLLMMEKDNVKPSSFTYKLLVDVKGRSSDIEGMEQIITSMKSEGLVPDIPFQATVAKYYIFGGFIDKAEAVLKDLEGEDIERNRDACKALLPLYAALGKADEVSRIWKVVEPSPRLDECLAVIEAWGKLGDTEKAEAVFERMLKTWKNISSRYYSALIKVYTTHKQLNKGKDLVKRMADNGITIGPVTWDALVRLYVEAGEVEKADSILAKAAAQQNNWTSQSSKNRLKPLYSSYMVIMEKYCERGDIHNAEKIFHRLRQAGYVGRMSHYQTLLQTYVNANTPAYGFRERLKADNVFPNRFMASVLTKADAFKKTAISDLLD
ncbi:hypothetical protein AMTRI_Chr01g127540 [Amborella trichopoda]|uniref:pentatricopeptide repeat-containing protein At1g80270, mitochondrial n=1 Tax=Amborella trichopoda TaxID=13333 RepID=UPI0005D37DDD|nr:pentatricopeptide repeat-containing protein At1g80270, mitochondrial [Amborella trichopoda]|eukprot:XP_011620381.1 pentatricopeptide repeat-containing protein At1g80270, mitochondrial [Amborella trichopoda]